MQGQSVEPTKARRAKLVQQKRTFEPCHSVTNPLPPLINELFLGSFFLNHPNYLQAVNAAVQQCISHRVLTHRLLVCLVTPPRLLDTPPPEIYFCFLFAHFVYFCFLFAHFVLGYSTVVIGFDGAGRLACSAINRLQYVV